MTEEWVDLFGYSRLIYTIMSYTRLSIMSSTQQPDDWIRVTSRDGFSFIVKRNVVLRSGTLRNMLDERRTSHSRHSHPLCSRDPFPSQTVSQRPCKKSVV
jgi:hypothetical protein